MTKNEIREEIQNLEEHIVTFEEDGEFEQAQRARDEIEGLRDLLEQS